MEPYTLTNDFKLEYNYKKLLTNLSLIQVIKVICENWFTFEIDSIQFLNKKLEFMNFVQLTKFI